MVLTPFSSAAEKTLVAFVGPGMARPSATHDGIGHAALSSPNYFFVNKNYQSCNNLHLFRISCARVGTKRLFRLETSSSHSTWPRRFFTPFSVADFSASLLAGSIRTVLPGAHCPSRLQIKDAAIRIAIAVEWWFWKGWCQALPWWAVLSLSGPSALCVRLRSNCWGGRKVLDQGFAGSHRCS